MKNILSIFVLQFFLCHLMHASHLSGLGEHYVAIRSVANDRCLTWEPRQKTNSANLVANRNQVSAWETFRVFCHTKDCSEISLKTHDDHWVTNVGYMAINGQKNIYDESKMFLEVYPKNRYAFVFKEGKYLNVNSENNVRPVPFALMMPPIPESALFEIYPLTEGFHPRAPEELVLEEGFSFYAYGARLNTALSWLLTGATGAYGYYMYQQLDALGFRNTPCSDVLAAVFATIHESVTVGVAMCELLEPLFFNDVPIRQLKSDFLSAASPMSFWDHKKILSVVTYTSRALLGVLYLLKSSNI